MFLLICLAFWRNHLSVNKSLLHSDKLPLDVIMLTYNTPGRQPVQYNTSYLLAICILIVLSRLVLFSHKQWKALSRCMLHNVACDNSISSQGLTTGKDFTRSKFRSKMSITNKEPQQVPITEQIFTSSLRLQYLCS